MDYSVLSREFTRDYTWDNSHASNSVAEYAREFFAPAFEGACTSSRFVTFLRAPDQPLGVMLSISVSTKRKDFSHSPIRTMAFLRAETPEESNLLVAFFTECLRKPDKNTLYNAESDVARAIESLYQTKKPDDLLRYCRSLPAANGSGVKPTGRWAIPRDDADARSEMAESLPALIGSASPFLIALTDRMPSDVLASLESMFEHAIVHIFSKAVSTKASIPGGGPNTRAIAATIGGAALLATLIIAAGRPCRKGGGCGGPLGGTNIVCHAIGGGEGSTNPIPDRGRGEEPAGETRQGDSITNAVTEDAEKVLTTTTNRLEQSGLSQP